MSVPSPARTPAKDALFWAGLATIALYYFVQPVARWEQQHAPWSPAGTGLCWTWRAEDGSEARCCRTDWGTWQDAAYQPCDGVHPGHGAPEPTR